MADGYYRCYGQLLAFRHSKIEDNWYSIIIGGEPVFQPKFTTTFKFTCKFAVDFWAFPPHSNRPIYRGRGTRPDLVTSVKIYDCRHAFKILGDQLHHWPLCAGERRELIMFALDRACAAFGSVPRSCEAIEIHCHVYMLHNHVYAERHLVDSATQQSMEEGEARMVPAAEPSIESLKRVAVQADCEESCSVCLEEMRHDDDDDDGGVAMAMPCSHVFHGDCIREWLRTSHYCPVCRFQMPTD